MNPELYMKPNKWIMYGGAVAMAGIILWIGSGEIQYRRQQALAGASADNASSNQRKQTYQEKLAELKRSYTHTQLPQGYELSADPRYAYNKNNGHWLDMQTGAVSYYDESSQIYIPIDTTLAATDAQGFDGVARLVVLESDCFVGGQIAEISFEDGLDVGRDRPQNQETRHLRIPDISVSRYHARIYFEQETKGSSASCDGSEDGEIEDKCSQQHNIKELYIVDLGSTHGTFVNQKRLSESKTASKPQRLEHRDQIAIGNTTLQVHLHSEWACSGCSNSGDNEISTMAVSKGKRDVAKAVKVDIRQEHMDNLNAIKQKYAAVHRRQKPSQYTDRARLRRNLENTMSTVQSSAQAASSLHSEPEVTHTMAPHQTEASIDSTNKGFAMLQSMGWTPGAG
ncbi:hypothetical protein LPJ68_005215 [Coemansia sp. RSA 1086]|nr:hypothetical protein LPJ68_005215 [Coemansia sp. RSA 1086]